MTRCIWCGEENADSAVEHIIPEALGCPSGFILTDGAVCRSCNNGLAHLDQAVIDDFDLFLYLAGVPRKGRRRPEVRNRGNLLGTWDDSGRVIAINMDHHTVAGPTGDLIAGYRNRTRHVRAHLRDVENVGELSFTTALGSNPQFVRGIVKIAFAAMAYLVGPQRLTDSYDSIRTYVMVGNGDRKVLVMPAPDDDTFFNQAWLLDPDGDEKYAIELRLGCLDFLVDLTPSMSIFPILKNKALERFGENGWCYLPA